VAGLVAVHAALAVCLLELGQLLSATADPFDSGCYSGVDNRPHVYIN